MKWILRRQVKCVNTFFLFLYYITLFTNFVFRFYSHHPIPIIYFYHAVLHLLPPISSRWNCPISLILSRQIFIHHHASFLISIIHHAGFLISIIHQFSYIHNHYHASFLISTIMPVFTSIITPDFSHPLRQFSHIHHYAGFLTSITPVFSHPSSRWFSHFQS